MGIEALLAWAYRDELPKATRGAVAVAVERDRQILRSCGEDPMQRIRDVATWIDVSPNHFGVIPDLSVDAEPHADALTVAEAVAALDRSLPGDVCGIDYLGDAGLVDLTAMERRRAHEDGLALAVGPDGYFRSKLSVAVIASAILGRARPVPHLDGVRRSFVCRNGKPAWFRAVRRSAGEGRPDIEVEIDGFDARARRPHADAYRKSTLEPALAPIVAERIDYQAWRAALDVLVDSLRPALPHLELVRSSAPWWPWEGESRAAGPRILEALRNVENGIPDAA